MEVTTLRESLAERSYAGAVGSPSPDKALPGVVDEEAASYSGQEASRSGSICSALQAAVLLSCASAGKRPPGYLDILLELAQDRGEIAGVDAVGVQVVLDLLKDQGGDADLSADELLAGAVHRRALGRVVSHVVTAAARPRCRWRGAGRRPAPSTRCPAR